MKKLNTGTKTKPTTKTASKKTTPAKTAPAKTAPITAQPKPATAEQLARIGGVKYAEQHSLLDGKFIFQLAVHGTLPPITINGVVIDPATAVKLIEFGSRKKFQNNYAKSSDMTLADKIDAMTVQLTSYEHGYFLASDYTNSLKPVSMSDSGKSKPPTRDQRIDELLFVECLNSVSEEQQAKMAQLPIKTVIDVLTKANEEKMATMRAVAVEKYEAELDELKTLEQEKIDAELEFLADMEF